MGRASCARHGPRRAGRGDRRSGRGRSRNACGIRGVGIRLVAASGRTVYRQPGRWAHPNRGYRSTVRCSGSSIWAVFYDGGAGGGKDPFAVHSGDGGITWRPVLPDSFDPWLGTWTLRGKTTYFVGWYLAAADRTLEPSSSLWVTKDGGRNFRKYSVPALLGYEPTAIRVVGDRVTISGHREVNGVTRTKSVGVVVS